MAECFARHERMLTDVAWPGNVRELQNICERAIVLAGLHSGTSNPAVITRSLIEPWLTGQPRVVPSGAGAGGGHTVEFKPSNGVFHAPNYTDSISGTLKQLEDIERDAIVNALVHFKGHRQKTAHALGIGVRTLGLKLKKWKQTGLVAESL